MHTSNIQIKNIFTDFLITSKLNSIVTDTLEKECYIVKQNDKQRNVKLSNRGGYQSPSISPSQITSMNLTELYKLISILELEIFPEISNKFFIDQIKLSNIWININSHTDYNAMHAHPESLFSGVFYVKVPEESKSSIEFFRDRRFEDYPLALHRNEKNTDYLNSRFTVDPQKNDLILFHSYLLHSVSANLSNLDRISISFNTRFI